MILILLYLVFTVFGDESIVTISYGSIQGVVTNGVRSFLGVPFVAPPVNNLRWTLPLPEPTAWAPNTLQATSFKPGCPQNCLLPPHTCPPSQSEDCLYLNIYTPLLVNLTQPQPVMVFLPGGHFEQGSPSCDLYQPYQLVQSSNVIVVAVAYRLGFLGWLATDFLGGNFGFSDQIQALQWVQKYIGAFGGDPSQVTLFGQSAGGTSIRAHLISPASDGLFHRAISQSDPFSLPMRDVPDAATFGNLFLSEVQCNDINCLRGLSIDTIISAQTIVEKKIDIDRPIENFLPFTPSVDGKLIPAHFFDAVKAGLIKNIPLIVGGVSEDAYLFVYKGFNFSLSTLDYEGILSFIFTTDSIEVTEEYPPEPIIGDKRPQLSIMGTDYIFECPARYTFSLIQKTNPNIYLYQFDHPLPADIWGPLFPYCANHVCHGAELPFLFYSSAVEPILNFTIDEINLSKSMTGYWGNFARTGNPNSGLYSPSLPWPQWEPSVLINIRFATPSSFIESNLRRSYCDFFDTIGYSHGW